MKKSLAGLLTWVSTNAAYIVWGLATGSVLGSLYFSEVRQFIPCELCWWTRILMYPMAFIMSVALINKPQTYWRGYIYALAVPAVLLGGFHSLLQWGVISESVTSCSLKSVVSCADPEIMWFGFITIPFLGFITNIAIIVATMLSNKEGKPFKWLKNQLS